MIVYFLTTRAGLSQLEEQMRTFSFERTQVYDPADKDDVLSLYGSIAEFDEAMRTRLSIPLSKAAKAGLRLP